MTWRLAFSIFSRPTTVHASAALTSNVRFWLGADIQREPAERPLMTLSGHSVEYAVQQVAIENQ